MEKYSAIPTEVVMRRVNEVVRGWGATSDTVELFQEVETPS